MSSRNAFLKGKTNTTKLRIKAKIIKCCYSHSRVKINKRSLVTMLQNIVISFVKSEQKELSN